MWTRLVSDGRNRARTIGAIIRGMAPARNQKKATQNAREAAQSGTRIAILA